MRTWEKTAVRIPVYIIANPPHVQNWRHVDAHEKWPQVTVCALMTPQITNIMGPTRGPPGSCRPQMGPMSAPWTLLSFPTPCTKVDYSLTPPSGTQSTILCGQGGTDPFKYLIKSSRPGAFVMTESAFCLGYQRAPWWRKFYPAWLKIKLMNDYSDHADVLSPMWFSVKPHSALILALPKESEVTFSYQKDIVYAIRYNTIFFSSRRCLD